MANQEMISLIKNNFRIINSFVNQNIEQTNILDTIKKIWEIEENKTGDLIIVIE